MLSTSNAESCLHEQGRITPESPRFARSGQMVTCLRAEMLYSEKRARDFLFKAIERLLSSQSGGAMILARLTREASRVARLDAEQAGYTFANWSHAGTAVVKALVCSGSLLGPDGQPIAAGITAPAATVGSLRDEYEDRAEAYLLEVLLRRLGNVTMRDHTALAHALFRQFDFSIPLEDLEDRVAILLARLADRVVLDGDRYVVRAVETRTARLR